MESSVDALKRVFHSQEKEKRCMDDLQPTFYSQEKEKRHMRVMTSSTILTQQTPIFVLFKPSLKKSLVWESMFGNVSKLESQISLYRNYSNRY